MGFNSAFKGLTAFHCAEDSPQNLGHSYSLCMRPSGVFGLSVKTFGALHRTTCTEDRPGLIL